MAVVGFDEEDAAIEEENGDFDGEHGAYEECVCQKESLNRQVSLWYK